MSATRSEPRRALDDGSRGAGGTDSGPRRGAGTIEAVGLTVLIAAGVGLRFVTASDLWLDEALSVNIAALPLDQLPDALRQDGHPPLYYALLHGWMAMFGEGDAAVRSMSGVLSVAALGLVWLAGRRLGGTALAWVATLLMAVLPYAIRYGTETRMYALVMLLVLVGYLLVADALRRPATGRLVAIAVVSGLLLLSHYWAFWLVAATVLVLGWLAVRGVDREQRPAAARTAVAVAAGGVLFLPWLPVFLDQMSSTGTPWATAVRPTTLVAVTVADLGGGGSRDLRDAELFGLALVVLVLLGLFGRTIDARRIEIDLHTTPQVRLESIVVALTVAIGWAASVAGSTAYASRYAAVVVPLVVLVAATGATRFTGRVARDVVVGGVSVLALALSAHLATVNRTQAGDLAAAIAARGADGGLVVVCPDQLGPAVERLVPEGVEVVAYPELGPADRVDWRDYEARHQTAPAAVAEEVDAQAGDRPVFVVSSPSYRVVADQCDQLRDHLATLRPAELVVAEDGDNYFEHASLTEYLAP